MTTRQREILARCADSVEVVLARHGLGARVVGGLVVPRPVGRVRFHCSVLGLPDLQAALAEALGVPSVSLTLVVGVRDVEG